MDLFSYLLGKKAGGTPTPQTMAEFGETLTNIYHSYQNYLKGTIASYPTTTSEATTLYTPNENNKYYIIFKTSANKYQVEWVAWDIARIKSATKVYYSYINISLYGQNAGGQWTNSVPFLDANNYFNIYGDDASTTKYYAVFNTLEEAIAGLKSNTTTYTSQTTTNSTYSSYSADYVIPYTNMVVFDNKTYGTFTQLTSQRISSNETIEVIS